MPTFPRSVAALAVVLVLSGAACSDDGGDGESSNPTSTTETTVDPTGQPTLPPPVDPTGTGLVCQPVGGAAEADDVIGVILTEFTVQLDAEFVSSGAVFVQVENAGDHPHELKIARADRPEDLPTNADGTVDENALGDDLVGTIERFANGDSCEGTFELTPGAYVFFDNSTSEDADGSVRVHFAEGMSATLTVG